MILYDKRTRGYDYIGKYNYKGLVLFNYKNDMCDDRINIFGFIGTIRIIDWNTRGGIHCFRVKSGKFENDIV